MSDPGTSGSASAHLLIAYDRHTSKVFCVDEVYERDPEKTVIGALAPRLIEKCGEYHLPLTDWKAYYDSAAAWFRQEFLDRFGDCGLVYMAVEKRPGEKEEGLDIINELIINYDLMLSTRCGNAIWELDNYRRDKNGKLPKKDDHQIDNLRYFAKKSGIVIGDIIKREQESRLGTRRKARDRKTVTLEQDMKARSGMSLMERILKKYGD